LRKGIYILIFLGNFSIVQAQVDPVAVYGQLFHDVQLSNIFEDSKTFADCIPKQLPETIVSQYIIEKKISGFNLKTFVHKNFSFPQEPVSTFKTDPKNSTKQHVEILWGLLKRNSDTSQNTSLIPLPHSYIVPGGRFREIYYWDSYFTMLGLAKSNHVKEIQDMVDNFAYLLDTYKKIPNGNRTYYLSRSQPPFFSSMVELLAQLKGEEIYTKYLPQLITEYSFWMQGEENLTNTDSFRRIIKMPDGETLNRYWDDKPEPRPESYLEDVHLAEKSSRPKEEIYRNIRAACESGWDFSSRWLKEPEDLTTIRTTEIIPVDLNCLLYHLESTLAKSYALVSDTKQANNMAIRSEKRKQAINKYFWVKESGFFMDYDITAKQAIKQYTLAGVFPLFFKICNQSQAEQVSKNLEKRLLAKGGLLTTEINSGQQWDSPNGWSPLQYIAIRGLNNYELHSLASEVSKRWLDIIQTIFQQTGKMMEKYNVLNPETKAGGGEYPSQDGFGWTNGVFLDLIK
jgi:alpha,alpha-trehalase